MKDDLISKQAAIRKYQEVCYGIKCSECPFLIQVNTEKESHLITDCKLEAFLHNLPSAQSEIIRCKECAHADEYYHCDYMTTWNDGDCFCSHAERRVG